MHNEFEKFNDVGPDSSSSCRAISNVSKSKKNYGF